MINKKIPSVLGIGIILIIAIVFGGILLLNNGKENKNNKTNEIGHPESITDTISQNEQKETKQVEGKEYADPISVDTQKIIDEIFLKWNLTFKLSSSEWHFDGMDDNKETGKMGYYFTREAIVDSKNKNIFPAVGFVFEKVESKADVISYAAYLKNENPFKTKQVLSDENEFTILKNGIGFIGTHNQNNSSEEHTIKIIYAINKNTGLTVVMDATSDVFNQVEGEFDNILRTIKFIQ
ncbi:MAG: hypothetical protein WAV16_03145 [Candidatus Moraniibacteriota bacterium]